MLIDLQINKDVIQKQMNDIEEYLKTNDKELSQSEKDCFNNEILPHLKFINSIDDLLERKRQGVYEGYMNIYQIEEYCGINRRNIEEFDSFNYWKNSRKIEDFIEVKKIMELLINTNRL